MNELKSAVVSLERVFAMKLKRFSRITDQTRKSFARAAANARPSIEPLEDRQLLSLTVDIRIAGSSTPKAASVTSVGQIINMQEWVLVTGNSSGNNDGLESVTGSLLSTKTSAGSVNGSLNANVVPGYTASGAQNGTIVDLNGDHNLDVGSNDNSQINGFINARAPGVASPGGVSGDTASFVVATMQYKVTSLSSGGASDINFRFRNGVPALAFDAVWVEDGAAHNDKDNPIFVGSPVVITGPNVTPPVVGSISGTVSKSVSGSTSGFGGVTVYLDSNNDGSFDNGETSTTTSTSGSYSLSNLSAGKYSLREVVPSGYTQTSPSSSPTSITVDSGHTNFTGENFTDTAVASKVGSISGVVTKVVSGAANSGFANVTVYLDNNNDGKLDSGDSSTVTSSSGSYSFGNLPAGTYHVRQVVPANFKQTSPSSTPTNITLSAGQNSTAGGFSDSATFTPGSISGTVYNDKNGNGKLDSGEAGLGGIQLYLDLQKDGKIDSGDPTTTTSSSGAFSFGGLAPGVYRLREVVLSGYKVTNPSAGYFDVTIQNNYQIKGENFFDLVPTTTGPVTLSGNVFKDLNGNGKRDSSDTGLKGWVVYIDLNGDGKFESNENNKTTDSNGNFSFVSLKAGTYKVRVIPLSGYTQTAPTSGYYTVNLSPNSPVSVAFAEHPASANTATGSGNSAVTLSGTVFSDVNSNGTKDSNEGGLAGRVVYVDLNGDGKFESNENNKTTDSQGNFSFVSLNPGTYTVRVIPSSGFTETTPVSGFYDVTLDPGSSVSVLFGEHSA